MRSWSVAHHDLHGHCRTCWEAALPPSVFVFGEATHDGRDRVLPASSGPHVEEDGEVSQLLPGEGGEKFTHRKCTEARQCDLRAAGLGPPMEGLVVFGIGCREAHALVEVCREVLRSPFTGDLCPSGEPHPAHKRCVCCVYPWQGKRFRCASNTPPPAE